MRPEGPLNTDVHCSVEGWTGSLTWKESVEGEEMTAAGGREVQPRGRVLMLIGGMLSSCAGIKRLV